ncbi:hypothetical protein BGZ63DRAFT_377121 [Mariannaea sp. PMI_226]|nr:hypothetical protein BGZ63DRAFT_377121 [Mariannaea sp. PMI_226]
MLIARAPLCLRLLPKPLAPLCCSYSTAPTYNQTQPSRNARIQRRDGSIAQKAKGTHQPQSSKEPFSRNAARQMNEKTRRLNDRDGSMRRYVPLDAQKLIVGGELRTNPDVWEFLQDTNIQWDTSRAKRLPLSPQNRHIYHTFACNISFSDEYIMSPYHLNRFLPWGHPLRERLKCIYRDKLENEPLWVHFIMKRADTSSIVHSVARRRLSWWFWSQLEELERKEPNLSRLKGTIFVELNDLRKAARAPAVQFGKAMAEAVMDMRRGKNYSS